MTNGLLEEEIPIQDGLEEPQVPTPAMPDAATPVGPRDITEKETVSGQLRGILEKEGPLQQTARTKAAEVAASRGLLSSTMAVQAGEQAVIESALPIAQQDAKTFAASGAAAQESAQRMAETAFTGEVSGALTEREYALKGGLAETEAELTTQIAESQKNFDIAVNNAKAEWDMQIRTMMEQNAFDIASMQDLGDTTRLRLDNALKQYMAELEVASNERQSTIGLAEGLGQQLQVALTNISTSNLGSSAKANAIKNAIEAYQSSLMTSASIASINITWDSMGMRRV